MGLKKGYVQVYTGNGKGKTTAALGLAFRAAGRGYKTYMGQFMKGQLYGEINTAQQPESFITIEQFGKDTFIHVRHPADPVDIAMAQEGLAKCVEAMLSGRYDIIICDEICVAHFYNLVTIEDMLSVIGQRPNGVELIFTGRYAPAEIVEVADLVTEMREIKHYYEIGVEARDGIER